MEFILNEVYSNKKVLITGHTGFKGSWLAYWLLKLNADVYGYSIDIPTNPSLFEQLNLKEKLVHKEGDVRDFMKLKDYIDETKPDIIFHLAAQSIVGESYINPIYTVETNIIGTVNLMEAVRQLGHKTNIVTISSDKCYENREWLFGYRENDAMGGYDPYSASKGAMEIMISSWRRSFFNSDNFNTHGIKLASVRAGNVIGGGDWADDRIIPDCFRHLLKSEPIELRSPQAMRPWQHVLEPLGGYLLLGSKLLTAKNEESAKYCDNFNFGPLISSNQSVGTLVDLLLEYWGTGKGIKRKKSNFHEASLLNLSITKAYHTLNWHPVWNFKTTVAKTVEWYKAFSEDPVKILEITSKQIEDYTNSWKNLEAQL